MDLELRASRHLALGDPRRLRIVDELARGDLAVGELAVLADMPSNLLAHHLDVLAHAGLIERHLSEGDGRRRYVALRWDRLPEPPRLATSPSTVAFVCTNNSARSQFAAALWQGLTGAEVVSAGTEPSKAVHPKAISVAAEHGIDLSNATPAGYDSIPWKPELVISVCDRAYEDGVPEAQTHLHWSVPDPVRAGDIASFRNAFSTIARRVEHLTGAGR